MSPDSTDLQIDVQEPESWSRRLSITVPQTRVQRVRTSVAGQVAQRARLPGFRAGKLPPKVVEKHFGPSIEQQTLDQVIQDAYREALESRGFQPITQGEVENVRYEPESDLRFEVRFEVQPEVKLERVSGFSVSRPVLEVGEAEVDGVIDRLLDERGEWVPLEAEQRPDYGDQTTVEITALDEAEGGEASPRSYRFVLGEGQAIPLVEEAIMTLAPGAGDDFTVRFPDDFGDPAQAGQEQRLHIRLVRAERKRLPEADDAFAGAVGDFGSMEALRERILTDLREDAERRADADLRGQLVARILEANPFDVPGSMTERSLQHMIGAPRPQPDQPRTPEQEEQMQQMQQILRPQAEGTLKRMLVVEHLAEREGLRATQDEVDARVEEIAARHERSASEVWLQLEKSGQLQALENEITEDKVFEHLLSQNTVA
ncbi:MAG: trigger factor [Gemmatimonadota bacterium]|nr:trigger factor [Gemmatimonadota bacterium]